MEEIIQILKEKIQVCKDAGEDLDSISYDDGVLITANQAQIIIDFYHKLNLAE